MEKRPGHAQILRGSQRCCALDFGINFPDTADVYGTSANAELMGSLLQRFAATDEIAPMIAFLASPLSIATNGAAMRVEGGCITTIL